MEQRPERGQPGPIERVFRTVVGILQLPRILMQPSGLLPETRREIFTLMKGLAGKTEEEQKELVDYMDRLFEEELGNPSKYLIP